MNHELVRADLIEGSVVISPHTGRCNHHTVAFNGSTSSKIRAAENLADRYREAVLTAVLTALMEESE